MDDVKFGNAILTGIMILVFTGIMVWVTCFHKPEPFTRPPEDKDGQ